MDVVSEAVRGTYPGRERRLFWSAVWSAVATCTHSQGDRPLDHLTYTCPSCAYLYLHMVITCSDYILPTSHAMSCHVYLICADVPQGSYE